MKTSKFLIKAFCIFLLLNFNLCFAQKAGEASVDVSDSINSVTKKSSVGRESNSDPDAQLAMSEKNYPVTAGDIYTLSYAAGSTLMTYSIPVDTTYKIRVANYGTINCKGKTYLELKDQVISIVQKNNPLSAAQFVLTSPATFRVTVTGEVKETVQKNAWALTRLSTFVRASFTGYSSSRNLKIISENGEEKIYDLFLAERKGDLSQDPYLRPGDTIIVDRCKRKVTIAGAVERPGTYDLLDGENLKELIDYYGNGLQALADISRTELYRPLTEDNSSGQKLYLNEKSYTENFELVCYDRITVNSYQDLRPVVFIEGAIQDSSSSSSSSLMSSTQIAKTFNNGEDYAFFVRANKNLFTSVSDLENAYIIRGSEKIPINLKTLLYDDTFYSKIEMKYNDTLLVPFKQYFVSVSGAVYAPGRYPYIPDRTWDYYIGLAGGFIKEKNAGDAIVITDVNGEKHKKSEFIQPEMTIEAKANSGLYMFNQYAPIITSILSIVSTSISVMAVTGVLK